MDEHIEKWDKKDEYTLYHHVYKSYSHIINHLHRLVVLGGGVVGVIITGIGTSTVDECSNNGKIVGSTGRGVTSTDGRAGSDNIVVVSTDSGVHTCLHTCGRALLGGRVELGGGGKASGVGTGGVGGLCVCVLLYMFIGCICVCTRDM